MRQPTNSTPRAQSWVQKDKVDLGGEWTNGKYPQSMGQIIPDLIGQVKDSCICFSKSDGHRGKDVIGFAFIKEGQSLR